MAVRRELALLGSLTLIFGCAHEPELPSLSEALSVYEVFDKADGLDGKTIHVRGMLRLGTNARSICQDAERLDEWKAEIAKPAPDFSIFARDCLTIAPNAEVWNLRPLSGQTVTLEGVFRQHYYAGNNILDLQRATNDAALELNIEAAKRLIREAGSNPPATDPANITLRQPGSGR